MEQHHVSKEALQGPQGPAPRPAEDFEKDLGKASKDLQDRESGTLYLFPGVMTRILVGWLANDVAV